MNKNQINYYSDKPTEPTGYDNYYNEREKEKLTLKSIISANQKYDFKSRSKISIYKGKKYNAYNKIEDNISFALLDKTVLSAEDFNKVTSHIIEELSQNSLFTYFLKGAFDTLETFKSDVEKDNVKKHLEYLKEGFQISKESYEKNLNLNEVIEGIKKDKIKRKFDDIESDRNKISGVNPNHINILHLAKEGFDLRNLSSVMTKAELTPILDKDFEEDILSEEDITVLE